MLFRIDWFSLCHLSVFDFLHPLSCLSLLLLLSFNLCARFLPACVCSWFFPNRFSVLHLFLYLILAWHLLALALSASYIVICRSPLCCIFCYLSFLLASSFLLPSSVFRDPGFLYPSLLLPSSVFYFDIHFAGYLFLPSLFSLPFFFNTFALFIFTLSSFPGDITFFCYLLVLFFLLLYDVPCLSFAFLKSAALISFSFVPFFLLRCSWLSLLRF